MPGPTRESGTSRSPPVGGDVSAGPPQTYGAIVWRQLRHRTGAMASLVVIVLLALMGTFAPLLGGGIPILWVEKGEVSWPIFHYLTNLEYAAIVGLLLVLALPMTARLLRRRAHAAGKSPMVWALLAHAAAWVIVTIGLVALREPERRYTPYLERRAEADSALFPLVAYPRQPGYKELANQNQRPSWEHPLGTGRNGDDVLIGILYGGRTAMTIGFVAVGISEVIGIALGALSGFFGGWIDLLMMRAAEIFMCIPRLILVIIILTVMPTWVSPIWMVVVVLGVTGWTGSYRLMRAELFRIRSEDYITAARALGSPTWRLLIRHAVPNGLAPILVGATFGIAGAVFLEVSLSFLNLVQTPSWGLMLTEGRQSIEHWWVWASAGGTIFLTVFVYNLLGEAIRDAIDPRLKI